MDIPQTKLKPLSRGGYPRRIIFFDTEANRQPTTKGEIQTFRIAWSSYTYVNNQGNYSEPLYKYWNDPAELCGYIETHCYERSETWLIAHNIFYDLTVSGFYNYFSALGWRRTFWYDSGLTYILGLHKGTKKLICLSSTNYFDFSLAKIGKMLDLDKLEIDVFDSDDEELSVYCRRDTEILTKAILHYIQFLKDNNARGMAYTKAAQAFMIYRQRFMDQPINIVKDANIKQFEKECYFGGRTEAFYIGKHPGNDFVSLDINSMYPYVMKNNKYPVVTVGLYENESVDFCIDKLSHYGACAEIEVNTDEACYPKRYDSKLIFPVGNFITNVTTEGLRYAIEHGHIISINKIVYYEMRDIFSAYVDHFYKLKKQYKKDNNKIYLTLVKKMLNSLYGKFGQGYFESTELESDISENYFRMEIYDNVDQINHVVTRFLNMESYENDYQIGKNSFIAIPAHVTEYSRFLLWEIIKQIGCGNVLYCDTDSVKFERKYLDRLTYKIDDYELGALSVDDEFKQFTIWGAKDYETENVKKIKGVPKNAKEIESGVWEYNQFCGQSTHLRLNLSDRYFVRRIRKERKSAYTKGYIQNNGYVLPYSFRNNERASE